MPRGVLAALGVSCRVRGPPIARLLTCGNFDTGVLAHVPQLDNHMVFPSRLQLAKGVFHGTIAGFYLVAPVTLPYEIFNCNCI